MGKSDVRIHVNESGHARFRNSILSSEMSWSMSQLELAVGYKQNPEGLAVAGNGAGSSSLNQDHVAARLSSNDSNTYANSNHYPHEDPFQGSANPWSNSDQIMPDISLSVPSSSLLSVDSNSTSSTAPGNSASSNGNYYHGASIGPEFFYNHSSSALFGNFNLDPDPLNTLPFNPDDFLTAFNVGAPVHERATPNPGSNIRPETPKILIPPSRTTQGALASTVSNISSTSSALSNNYYQSDTGSGVHEFSEDTSCGLTSPSTPVTPASARGRKRLIEEKARMKEGEAAGILLEISLDASKEAKEYATTHVPLKFRTKSDLKRSSLKGKTVSKRLKELGRANLMANSGYLIRYYQLRCRVLEEQNRMLARG